MSEIVTAPAAPEKKVRRAESFISAVILAMGLAAWHSGEYSLGLAALLFGILPIAASVWVLRLPLFLRLERLDIYATIILPILLYLSMLFFLDEVANRIVAWGLILASLPLYYLTFISLSAVERYSRITNHVGRVIISVLALFTAYVSYSYVFQSGIPVWQGIVVIYLLAWLLFVQGFLYWTGGNTQYSVFYASFCALIMGLLYLGIYLWPMGYLVTGMMMMSGHYVLTGIMRAYFRKKMTLSVVFEHVAVSVFVLTLILINVDWGFVL